MAFAILCVALLTVGHMANRNSRHSLTHVLIIVSAIGALCYFSWS